MARSGVEQGVRGSWRLDQRGQLVIPALFVIPSLVLFIYLIFETAKLSAEKIKHQFALDTAVFVEMANYSDFLNRTAYVNGAFPSRVCYEAFSDPELTLNATDDGRAAGNVDVSLYDYLVESGLCPYSPKCKDPSNCSELAAQNADDWGYTYKGKGCASMENCTEGRDKKDPDVKPGIVLFSWRFAKWHHVYFPMVEFLLQNYNVIFSLLGIVEDSQIAVFQRLVGSHYFYSRAYTMNVPGERATSASQLPVITPKTHRTATADAYMQVLAGDRYEVGNIQPQPMPLLVLTTVAGLDAKQGISPLEIRQTWRVDRNYFKVDGNSVLGHQPYVHATVEVSGGNIWPGATPRYQVRIYP